MKCPQCGIDIDYLDYAITRNEWGRLNYRGDSRSFKKTEDVNYHCPICASVLYTSILDAGRALIDDATQDLERDIIRLEDMHDIISVRARKLRSKESAKDAPDDRVMQAGMSLLGASSNIRETIRQLQLIDNH